VKPLLCSGDVIYLFLIQTSAGPAVFRVKVQVQFLLERNKGLVVFGWGFLLVTLT